MAKKELFMEARNVISGASKNLDEKILSKATELKPRVVSLASRLNEILGYIDSLLGGVEQKISEETKSNIASLGSWFYITFYKDSFSIIRNKPYTIVISYRKGEGRVYLRTRKFKANISPRTIELSQMAMKVEIDLTSPRDFENKLPEIRYLLRTFGKIIEYQLLPVAEKRLGVLA